MNLYQQIIAANIPHAHHESDLYIPVNDETRKLIEAYEYRANVRTFTSNIDKKLWYDIPFAYTPFWESKGMTA